MISKKRISSVIAMIMIVCLCFSSYAAVGTPSNINYSISTAGTFLYCNNPESVYKDDLADPAYGKHSVLEETVNAGNVRFFAEHNNFFSGVPYTLCLRAKNTSQTNSVYITILKRASSNSLDDPYGKKTIENFYTMSNLNYPLRLGPGESKDIMYSVTCPTGSYMTALAQFTVSAPVQISEYLYSNSISSDAHYEGYKYDPGKTQMLTYKGVGRTHSGSVAYPVVSNTYRWEINNSTSGNLPVTYNGITGSSWNSNATYGGQYILSDIIYYKESDVGFTFGSDYSLGNWGVEYNDTYEIKNSGTTTRTININYPTSKFYTCTPTARDDLNNAVAVTPTSSGYSFKVASGRTVTVNIVKCYLTNVSAPVTNSVSVQ